MVVDLIQCYTALHLLHNARIPSVSNFRITEIGKNIYTPSAAEITFNACLRYRRENELVTMTKILQTLICPEILSEIYKFQQYAWVRDWEWIKNVFFMLGPYFPKVSRSACNQVNYLTTLTPTTHYWTTSLENKWITMLTWAKWNKLDRYGYLSVSAEFELLKTSAWPSAVLHFAS